MRVTLLIACLLSAPAWAQDVPEDASTDAGIEMNLDALDALDPARDEGRAKLPAPPPLPEDGVLPEITPEADALAIPAPQRAAAPEPESSPPETVDDPAMAQALRDVKLELRFDPDSASLGLDGSNQLDQVAALARRNPVRIQVRSFSGANPPSDSSAQRLSLKRAIEIRGYLMNQGVEGSRIDLKPGGKPAEDADADRARISLLPQ